MLKPLLWIIAAAQLILAILTLFLPLTFFGWMGLTVPAPDNAYMIGMLGARFLAYGIGMVMLARAENPSRFWIGNMLLIQIVDLTLALTYLGLGHITWQTAGLPMVNAAIFSGGLAYGLFGRAGAQNPPGTA